MGRRIRLSLIAVLLPTLSYGQLLQDYSNIANIRHYAVDSLRIGGGVVIFDYNNDGWEDIYLAGGESNHQLYRNTGNFDFERVTEDAGLAEITVSTFGVSAADLNNDGWTDLFVGTAEGQHSRVLKNNGDGTFSDVTNGSGIEINQYWSTAVTFADLNGDGLLDIYVGNYARNPTVPLLGSSVTGAYPNELYLSQGEFIYEEVAEATGVSGSGFTLAVRASDPDQDHDMDLYVVNDFGVGGNEVNRYYENDGQGNFTEKSQELGLNLGIFGMGAGLGDYDADGDFDWYVSDIGQNHLLSQMPDGIYVDVTTETLAIGDYVSWGGEFLDSNHDTRLDLFMANGAVLGEADQPLLYYENREGQYLSTQFNLVKQPFFARGIAYSDLDNDGDLDIVVNPVAETDTSDRTAIPVIRNTTDLRFGDRGYLQVQVESEKFTADAYGSILKLHLADGSSLLRMVDNGGSFASKHSSLIHFGTGTVQIDSLEVFWPNGSQQIFYDLTPNALIRIHDTEGLSILRGATVTSIIPEVPDELKIYPVPATDRLVIETNPKNPATEIKLYSTNGRLLHKYPLVEDQGKNEILLNQGLHSGIYLLEVLSQDSSEIHKVIIQP